MYNIIKTYNGGSKKQLNKVPYELFRDAQAELIDEFRQLYESRVGMFRSIEEYDNEFNELDPEDALFVNDNINVLDDIMERVLTDKNFSSYRYDNYIVQIVRI